MSTEKTQNEQSTSKNPSNTSQVQEENADQPQKIIISPDSVDQIKNVIQPLKNDITEIDSTFDKFNVVPKEEENLIVTKEIPGKKTVKTTTTTTTTTITTIIKNGEKTTSTEKVTTVEEKKESKEGDNEGNTKIETVVIKDKGEDDEKLNNINNINKIIINKAPVEENVNMISNVTFGAPQQSNYNSAFLQSNVTFGVNNSNINENQNNIPNMSNISDSNDKSSETGSNVIIEIKKENEDNNDINENKDNNIEVKFGAQDISQEKNDQDNKDQSSEREEEIKIEENKITYEFIDDKENKENEEKKEDKENKEDKEDENKKEENEPGEIREEIIEVENIDNEEKNEEEKGEKKGTVFTQNLFDNYEPSKNQGENSIMSQKLFPDKSDINQNKIEENEIRLIQDNNLTSILDNSDKTKETFLKNNISIIPPSEEAKSINITTNTITNINTNNEPQSSELPSAVFGNQDNSKPPKTLNDIIQEGEIYNADSAKKTQETPTIFSVIENPNIINEDANANINDIKMQSINKGKNPYRPNEPQNINSSINNNNIDTNDNIDTNESTANRGIRINMANKNKSISSPLANLGKEGFLPLNQQVNEIHVNPIFSDIGSNPFGGLINDNKKEGGENKTFKSNMFPGLDLVKEQNKAGSAFFSLDNKVKSNPIFPGSANDLDVKKSKSNLFIDDNKKKEKDQIDDKKEDNKEGGNIDIQFSEVISEGKPNVQDINNNNQIEDKKIEKENNIDKNDYNINIPSNQESVLPDVDSLIIPNNNDNKEDIKEEAKEKIKESIPLSLNTEIKEEEVKNSINIINEKDKKPILVKSIENKENENPEENELIMSNIINSNIVPNISTMNNIASSFNLLNQSQNKPKEEQKNPRKALFGDTFINSNKLNLADSLSGSYSFLNNKEKNESIFGNNNENKNEPKKIFENNQGKSIFNNNQGMSFHGEKITPIKISHLKKEENKENKEDSKEELSSDIQAENGDNEEDIKEQIKKPEEEKLEIHLIKTNKDNNINNLKKIQLNKKPETNFAKEEEVLSENEQESIPNYIVVKGKPLNRKIYSDLIKKLYRITEKKKNDINIPEKKRVTIYDPTLSNYLKDLEAKILNLKKSYIDTLVKRHFEKSEEGKKQIVKEMNLPKKRNELKNLYREMMKLVKEKLEKEHQKYYYIEILKILKKYENIEDKEMNSGKKAYKINLEKNKNREIKIKETKNKESGGGYNLNSIFILIPLFCVVKFFISNNQI